MDNVYECRLLVRKIGEAIDEARNRQQPTAYLEKMLGIFKRGLELQLGSPPRTPVQIWAAYEMLGQRRLRRPDAYSGKDFNPSANKGKA